MPQKLVLGLDIGGTNIKVGLVSESGELLQKEITSTPLQRDLPQVVEAIVPVVRHLVSRSTPKPEGMGIAAPGVVDLAGELVLRAPNFPTWHDEPVREALEKAVGLPSVLGNDVDLFGLAEHRWGAAVGMKHVVAVAVGTGVGGAVIINGELYRGAAGGAAELGFTVISPTGPEVIGIPGVLEGYIGRKGFDDIVLRLFTSGEVPTPRRITELAAAGDPRAQQVHSEVAGYLAEAASSWLAMLNPEAIVLGGGTLANASYLIEEFDRKLRARALKTHTEHLRILPSKLGYFAGTLGAAALWLSLREKK
jgi:glucokinase